LIIPRPARRGGFWVYALVLFTATHTPGVQFGTRFRWDILIHIAAFGLWAACLALAGFFGPPCSWRNIRCVAPIATAYAAADEALQAIPFVHRHAAVDDWLANVTGIVIACSALLWWGHRHPGAMPEGDTR
jgi:VanZ family protein